MPEESPERRPRRETDEALQAFSRLAEDPNVYRPFAMVFKFMASVRGAALDLGDHIDASDEARTAALNDNKATTDSEREALRAEQSAVWQQFKDQRLLRRIRGALERDRTFY